MINKSLSLLLGISLSFGVLATETLAYPNRVRFSTSPGIHRTIIAPNSRIGNRYPRGSADYGGRGNYRFRERITIERDQRGYCYNCGNSNPYHRHRNYRGYGRNSRFVPQDGSYPYYR
ncbi:hypothetical protein [Crocosphaera sp.]|uniref:hypothetical protein n=1 Tax=Crocosphaera sp. TaxID=2729996 RepID=UPI003F1EFE12|nr:hypothetical protein [Crocosphaera sp.]